MKIIEPYVQSITFHIPEGYTSIEKWLEEVGRTCYKSEDKITETSATKFIKMITKRGHHAMLEHAVVTARIVADRGVSHQLIRHSFSSFAQESTRYCNYSKKKHNAEITVVRQPGMTPEQEKLWNKSMLYAEAGYLDLIDAGVKAEIARSVLPIGVKTEIVITANLREWMHIFSLRCDTPAHPIIRKVCLDILKEFNDRLPSIYSKQGDLFLK